MVGAGRCCWAAQLSHGASPVDGSSCKRDALVLHSGCVDGLADSAGRTARFRDARHPGALYLHGVLAFESDQLESAQRWIERAIEVQRDPAYYHLLFVVKSELGDFAGAAQTAQQGLALQPDSPAFHFNLAAALQNARTF